MSWYFFVDRRTGRLAAIIMSGGFGLPLSARFGIETPDPSIDDYWESVGADFINGFLNDNFELYEYDLDSEDDESNLAANLDPADELAWEIPPVQDWVKGNALDRDQVDQISHFLGYGSGFIAEEIIAGDLHSEVTVEPEPVVPARRSHLARCLWCQMPVERRYNFEHNEPLGQFDLEGFESPVVWSDGFVMEAGETEAEQLFPNHYGDSVLACSACGAMFLASAFEKEYPRVHWYPDHESWTSSSRLVVAGSCPERANEDEEQEAFLTWSRIEQTMRFLKRAQSYPMINWEEWTALQQAINWAADDDRQAKISGKQFKFSADQDLKSAIALFLQRISQIQEGTLGSLSPFHRMHHENLMDENFFIHNYEVQELLPVANMMRISGARDFSWATPSHPAIRESEATFTGWSEFDQWIALRGKAILAAADQGITDWAVAVDASGDLFQFEIG